MRNAMNQHRRTHTCGELTSSEVDREVTLNGWVDSRRDHGGLVFVDLRDRYGITQAVVEHEGAAMEIARSLRSEDVIAVVGRVRQRPAERRFDRVEEGRMIARRVRPRTVNQ